MAKKTQGTELFYLSAPGVMTKIGKITGITGTGGARSQIDITDLDDTTDQRFIPGLRTPGSVSVPINFDTTDAAAQALLAMYDAGAEAPGTFVIGMSDGVAPPTAAASVITYPTTRSWRTFQGYVADFPVDVALNSKYEGNVTIQRTGPITSAWKAP